MAQPDSHCTSLMTFILYLFHLLDLLKVVSCSLGGRVKLRVSAKHLRPVFPEIDAVEIESN